GGTADRNRSHWSTSKTPSYTKSVSWQHHLAAQLSISEPTVKEHISNILKKIGVNSRVEAITLLHGKQEPSE
ncbi:LuxR C-terminal-related transcriptional regulator, partial [Enterobacter hormaechei]|uniref:LuxR C-terminal-related transcriptional regulator n=1 Tax=Enterobacter hormaechei TaxID=158836 RepID=UPI001F0A8FE4